MPHRLPVARHSAVNAAPTGPTDALPDPVKRLPVLRRVEEARQAMRSDDLPATRALLEALVAEEPGLGEPRMMLAGVLARQGDLAAVAGERFGAFGQDDVWVRLMRQGQQHRCFAAAMTFSPVVDRGEQL